MDYILTPDSHGIGDWVMILDCPGPQNQELLDTARGVSGPSFASCAHCEHQIGGNTNLAGIDGDSHLMINPGGLVCGFPATPSDPDRPRPGACCPVVGA